METGMAAEDQTRPVGTWFYTWAGEDVYHLWQETERGPKRAGIIYNQPSIDFICERLNESQRS
jgi:hypothetical protein